MGHDRKWAWPWRWGEANLAGRAGGLRRPGGAGGAREKKFGKRGKAPARAVTTAWPPAGGSLDDIAELLKVGIQGLGDGYHACDYRRKYATRTMALGMFSAPRRR